MMSWNFTTNTHVNHDAEPTEEKDIELEYEDLETGRLVIEINRNNEVYVSLEKNGTSPIVWAKLLVDNISDEFSMLILQASEDVSLMHAVGEELKNRRKRKPCIQPDSVLSKFMEQFRGGE